MNTTNRNEIQAYDDYSILFITYKKDILEVKIDNEDVKKISQYNWGASLAINVDDKLKYSFKTREHPIKENLSLARYILNCDDSEKFVTMLNDDSCDLRKLNLKIVNKLEYLKEMSQRKRIYKTTYPNSKIRILQSRGVNPSYRAAVQLEKDGKIFQKNFCIKLYGGKTSARKLAEDWIKVMINGSSIEKFEKERMSKFDRTAKNGYNVRVTQNENIIENEGDHSVLVITRRNNKFRVLIDTEDVEKVRKYHWYITGNDNLSIQCKKDSKGFSISIRKVITGLGAEKRIIVKDGNPLNLRKNNLFVIGGEFKTIESSCEENVKIKNVFRSVGENFTVLEASYLGKILEYLIDKEDVERVRMHHWHVYTDMTNPQLQTVLPDGKAISLKNFLLNKPGVRIGFTNGDIFDLSKENLFIVNEQPTLKVTEICRDSQGKAHYREKVINPEGEVLSKKEIEVPKDVSSPMLSLDDERERKDKIRETKKMEKKENFTFESMSIGQLYCEIENNPRKYNGTTWEVLSMVGLVFSKGDPLHKYENVNEFTIREDRPVVFDKLTKHERIAFFPISTIVKRQEKWEEVSVMEGIQAFKEGKRIRVSHLLHNICDVFDGKETSKLPIDILEAMNYKWEIWR